MVNSPKPPKPPKHTVSQHSGAKRLLRVVVLLFMPLCIGAVLSCVVLARIPPSGRPTVPVNAVARGEAFENALIAAVTKVRDPAGETWAIAIDPADINAWLATRLPKWIEHDPSLAPFARATTVRIGADDGALVVEAPVGPKALGLVGTLRMPIALDDSPGAKLMVDIGTTRIGLLPVPLSDAGWQVAGVLAEELARFESRYPERRFRLADGRSVELRAIACEGGRVKIRLMTLPQGPRPGFPNELPNELPADASRP